MADATHFFNNLLGAARYPAIPDPQATFGRGGCAF
jgi:hypothetical protein